MIKTESMGSRFQHPNQMQTISHFKTMSEMKPKISSSGKVKAETIKVEQSGSSYGFESRNQQEAEEVFVLFFFIFNLRVKQYCIEIVKTVEIKVLVMVYKRNTDIKLNQDLILLQS